MPLVPYSIKQLISAAKAVIRGEPALTQVGTESGTDHALIIEAAAWMFQGMQVAAQHVYEQLFPSTADAENRDRMIDQLGLVLTKEATKARGYILITSSSERIIPKGKTLTFPGTVFPDGEERSYTTLEDAHIYASATIAAGMGAGSHEHKIRLNGALYMYRTGDMVNQGLFTTAIRGANFDDQTFDLIAPFQGAPTVGGALNVLGGFAVPCECTVAGKIGNAPRAMTPTTTEELGYDTGFMIILEMGGGGDAVEAIDPNSENIIALIEDTMAGAPSLGNAQHWRELALSCPDVALDDAVVFQHARGPGTIDIVAIGKSQRVDLPDFEGSRTDFFWSGMNGRRIGPLQAQVIEDYLKGSMPYVNGKASYFDDIKVRSVEYDWNGEAQDTGGTDVFRSMNDLDIQVVPFSGYGPDSGVALNITPHTWTDNKLYGASPGDVLDDALKVGDRVWLCVRHYAAQNRATYITIVLPILSIANDRTYVTVETLAGKIPTLDQDTPTYDVMRWGTAGPLTMPVLGAVFDYFDTLGPGSYIEAPKDPAYIRTFFTGTAVAPDVGRAVLRWPPEARRWPAGFRGSELASKIMKIKGVQSIALYSAANVVHDFDPMLFRTLALRGAIVRYA